MTVYADTSFLASLYVRDPHSAAAVERMKEKPRVWFTPLLAAECSHAIAKQIFYRKISQAEADTVFDILKRDRVNNMWLETAMPEAAFHLCADLGRRYAPTFGMRTLDTLHVACALELKAERFWTFDERQAKLAKTTGLKTA
ncbi:MAG: type II toxin-antitoxin system VapC family toxin [Candidatus Sulfotelmatobacter sp.]